MGLPLPQHPCSAVFLSGLTADVPSVRDYKTVNWYGGLLPVSMGFIGYVQQHFRSAESSDLLIECRHCGTSLEPDDEVCPSCGGRDIASFRL